MNYAPTISNEEASAMEAVAFDGKIVVVNNLSALEDACKYLLKQPILGFDTETRPSFQAGVSYKVSLLQLSTMDRCYLIRLNKVPLTRQLQTILKNPDIKKVGVNVRDDIRNLNALRRFTAGGFIELQHEVHNYGIQEQGLRKISAIVLGKKVSKAQRLSNWEANRLTPQQIMYAATDAWSSLKIYLKLTEGETQAQSYSV